MTEQSEKNNIEQILRDGMMLGESRRGAFDKIDNLISLSKHKGVIHSTVFNNLLLNLIEIAVIKEKYPEASAPRIAYEHILNEAKLTLPYELYQVLVERGNLKYQREKAELLTQ